MSKFTETEVTKLLSTIMHNALPNHHVSNLERNKILKKYKKMKSQFGELVLYENKTAFGKHGYIVDNKADLAKKSNYFTHWTPNTYFGVNKDELNTPDKRIRAINLISIDVDCQDQHDALYIWETRLKGNLDINSNIKPTYVLLTDKGLQIGFAFKKAIFLPKNYEKKLYAVDLIYKNIINFYKNKFKGINFDEKNTAFGIQRLPNQDNLLRINKDNLTNYLKAIIWSKNETSKNKFIPKLYFGKNSQKNHRQIDADWYYKMTSDEELAKVTRKGARNTLITTLTLANKGSKVDQSSCEQNMQRINQKMGSSLPHRTVTTIVKSIYRGSCKGAQNSYINQIIETYSLDITLQDKSSTSSSSTGKNVHIKKKRENRVYLHPNERIDDLIAFIDGNTAKMTLQELSNALGYKNNIRKKQLKTLNQDSRIKIKKVSGGQYNIKIDISMSNLTVASNSAI